MFAQSTFLALLMVLALVQGDASSRPAVSVESTPAREWKNPTNNKTATEFLKAVPATDKIPNIRKNIFNLYVTPTSEESLRKYAFGQLTNLFNGLSSTSPDIEKVESLCTWLLDRFGKRESAKTNENFEQIQKDLASKRNDRDKTETTKKVGSEKPPEKKSGSLKAGDIAGNGGNENDKKIRLVKEYVKSADNSRLQHLRYGVDFALKCVNTHKIYDKNRDDCQADLIKCANELMHSKSEFMSADEKNEIKFWRADCLRNLPPSVLKSNGWEGDVPDALREIIKTESADPFLVVSVARALAEFHANSGEYAEAKRAFDLVGSLSDKELGEYVISLKNLYSQIGEEFDWSRLEGDSSKQFQNLNEVRVIHLGMTDSQAYKAEIDQIKTLESAFSGKFKINRIDCKDWKNNNIVKKYDVFAVPTAFVLNREGRIAAVHVHDTALERALRAACEDWPTEAKAKTRSKQ